MPDMNERVNALLEDIRVQSEQESRALQKEMDQYKEAQLSEARASYEALARKYVMHKVQEGSARISYELSVKHKNARDELVRLRTKMTDEIIQRAEKKLQQFTKTDEYLPLLCRSAKAIASVLHSNRITLYVRQEDLVYADEIKNAFGKYCSIESDKSIRIGGIRGYDRILYKLVDETLDEKLSSQREYFVNHSGLTVSVR